MINIQPLTFMDNRYNEVWKPLVFDGINDGEYLISSFGNIYDLKLDKYVKLNVSKSNGYVYVNLRHNEGLKSGNLLLHRLVASNFAFKQTYGQDQVNHIDGNKQNNNAYNLEWCTPKENTNHAFETGLAINNIGENSHLSKLTNDQVEIICQLLSEGMSYNDILLRIGLEPNDNNRDMIGNIYRGIAWKHISCKYTFPPHDERFKVNSLEKINLICSCIEKGMTNREVYEFVYNKPFKTSKESKKDYELIRRIRNKKLFVDVSSNYNF